MPDPRLLLALLAVLPTPARGEAPDAGAPAAWGAASLEAMESAQAQAEAFEARRALATCEDRLARARDALSRLAVAAPADAELLPTSTRPEATAPAPTRGEPADATGMPWWGSLILAGVAASASVTTFVLCLDAGGSRTECGTAAAALTASAVGGVGLAF